MHNRKFIVLTITIPLLVTTLESCSNQKSASNIRETADEVSGQVKPGIERPEEVLEIGPLYRAKRYESVEEAVQSKDTVYKLVLHSQRLGAISPDIGKLIYLNSLDLAYNDLKELPEELVNLKYLQGFYINGNNISGIPDYVYDFKYLYRFDASENQVTEISPEINNLKDLTVLNLGTNGLSSIPIEIYNLTNLVTLLLNHNQLNELPEGISNLTQLTRLRIEHNNLTYLPPDLGRMYHLEELWLQGNPIPDEDIIQLKEQLPATKIRF